MKKLWEWLKRPSGWGLLPLFVFTAVFIALSITLTVVEINENFGFVSYIFYALAAVTLAYSVYATVINAPKLKRKITEKLKSNKFTANVLGDYDFKTTVFAIISFCITAAFAVMNTVSAFRYLSVWYGAIAAYYFVLILFRGAVLLANNKCAKKFADNANGYEKVKWKIYLASGALLILLEIAMVGAVTQMMLSGRPTQSGQIMAIASAAYTFYKISMAIYNLIKARKLSNPVTQSLRNLNFADACMSIVSLTVLMISTFEGGDVSSQMQYVKYIVGFVVCAGIIAMAAYMIIKANKQLNLLTVKGENTDER